MNQAAFAGIIVAAPIGFTLIVIALTILGMYAMRRFNQWRARRRQKKELADRFTQILKNSQP